MRETDDRIVVLCEPNTQHTCPTVKLGKEEVEITDDFGGKVRIPRHQWEILQNKVRAGEL